MTTATFAQFLLIARRYLNLIVDLCAEQDVISRSKLLNYMERHGIPPAEKDALLDELCKTLVLLKETENSYTVNHVVVDLVNYYERRGRLTNAKFLKDQIVEIARLTDQLQTLLFADEKDREAILDRVDDLYRLVREVREAGESHYIACMRLFGDLKRASDAKKVEQRLAELETIQRRHINPLRELIDPNAEYAHKIASLKRRMLDLRAQPELLAQSQELVSRQHRLNLDLHYIDHILLRNFEKIVDTARTLLQSLIEEKNIKDAIAGCLGNLDAVWAYLESEDRTVVATGRQSTQAPTADLVETFFAEVIHLKLLPNPTPLDVPDIQPQPAETVLLRNEQIWRIIRTAGNIPSWPAFVIHQFRQYPGKEQLRAIALPLTVPHTDVQISRLEAPFNFNLAEFRVQMKDFSVTWREKDGRNGPTKEPGNLPQAFKRLPV
jgi:hypothetical protein